MGMSLTLRTSSSTARNADTLSGEYRPRQGLHSGLARARQLAATLPAGTSRQDTISAFMGLGLSKDTASAYYSVINRKS